MYLLILLLLLFNVFIFFLYWKEKSQNKTIEEINNKIKQQNKEFYNENKNLLDKQKIINAQYNQKQQELIKIQQALAEAEQNSRDSFENYNDILDKEYLLKEQEYQKSLDLLDKSYNEIQNETLAEISQIRADLDKLSATRAAAIQAQLKEKEIQQQEDFYSLSIDKIDKKEIKILQSIEDELRDPRPLRMVVWQSYYLKKANELAARVLGSNEVCGIYKITHKQTQMCYIGQSKKVKERFREHMKCGLGIDTPANNKLYQAMLKDGLEAFTFELLEECAAADLNEKETFYINLYNSYHFGYNSNSGIKKA